MAEEDSGRVRRAVDESAYSNVAFSAWEDALEKLKALDYEVSFCKPNNVQPFSRVYFSVAGSNASLQWRSFQEISSWLINLGAGNGRNDFFKVDKYDDPNTAVNKLMLALTSMGFELNFPANRLKQAYGEAVCSVLNFLAQKALAASGHVWRRPVYAQEETAEEAETIDGSEMAGIADEAEVQEEEVEEEDFAEMIKADEEDEVGMADSQAAMLETKVDSVEWKRELELVGPRLKLRMLASSEGQEWRGHVEQTKKHEEAIQAALPITSTQLAVVGNEMTESVEKMRSKERFINTHHAGLREEYKQLSEDLKAVEAKHQKTSSAVGELTDALAALSDEMEELKEKMDSKGETMSEASPLVSIKQALHQIKAEIKTFDLRIGVVSHTLLSTKMKRGKGDSPKGGRGGGNHNRASVTGTDDDFDISDSGD